MSESQAVILLLTFFAFKHFVVDFLLQRSYQYSNKGTYGHPGGILHAGLHGLGTTASLWIFADPIWCVIMALFDSIAHYHIDWAKTNLSHGLGINDHRYWVWFGLDQTLHYLTYIAIIAIIIL